MRITYLGTAASEGWPGVFCNCDNCKRAKKAGGKNLRTRSQALINDDLLIDFPIDTYAHMLNTGIDLSAAKYCFVTHSHNDHFAPADAIYRFEGCFSYDMTSDYLDFYGNEAVNNKFDRIKTAFFDAAWEKAKIRMHEIKAFETIKVGDYEITPLPANHAPKETPYVYLIKNNGKILLYLHDTGLPSEEFYDYFKKNKVRADLISYDCTYVANPSFGGHMGLDTNPGVKEKLEELGVSDENTISVINHFSHNGKLIHDELVPVAEKLGFITAYDGMVMDF